MLVIDENKLKLLRMKEKLLEVSVYGHDEVLSQYGKIVIDIDKDMYNSLLDMIKNTNYHNQSLEEQLEFLTNLEKEYNSFNEFQCRYRNIYEKHTNDKLELSPINDIYIDKIKERINAINGYLINKQNLVRYREDLEELNVQLINAEKKKNEIESRFSLLEKELKTNVLNVEGRLDNNGNLEYASIVKEFEKYGLNLEKLLGDGIIIQEELDRAKNALSSEEDKMNAAKVCYNNMPNIETKKLYNVSYFDVLNANYKLMLLNFADLIVKQYSEYEEIRNKRIKIKELIKERTKLLNDLGIKFAIDPFSRIKLNEQLEIIELLGKNLQDVYYIREKIKNTFNLVDELNEKNNELYFTISQKVDLFNDENSKLSVVTNTDSELDNNQVDKRKIINVRDISGQLNLNLIHGKTNGVINRVYELFSKVPIDTKNTDVVPDLVIEKDSIFTDEVDTQDIFEDNKSQKDDIFVDGIAIQDIFSADEIKSDVNNDLFSEVEPFKETVLFTNKYDDVFAKDSKIKEKLREEEMPELFFDTEQKAFDTPVEESEEQSSELSLDEQIKALKLVA